MNSTKQVWAILVMLDGSWHIYKEFKKADKKAERKARKYFKGLRANFSLRFFQPNFKVSLITMEDTGEQL